MTYRTVSGRKSWAVLLVGWIAIGSTVACGREREPAREGEAEATREVDYVRSSEQEESNLRVPEERRVGEELARTEEPTAERAGEVGDVVAATIVRVPSRDDARQTMQRLESELRTRNMQVMSRLDLAARPTRGAIPAPLWLIVFRDPDHASLAAEQPVVALALPNQFLVFEDPAGNAVVAYESPTRRLEQANLAEMGDRVAPLERRLREVAHAAAGQPAEERGPAESPTGMDDQGTLPGAQPGAEGVLQDRPGAGTGSGPAQTTHGATGRSNPRSGPDSSDDGASRSTGTTGTTDGTSGGAPTAAPGAGPTGGGGVDREIR